MSENTGEHIQLNLKNKKQNQQQRKETDNQVPAHTHWSFLGQFCELNSQCCVHDSLSASHLLWIDTKKRSLHVSRK